MSSTREVRMKKVVVGFDDSDQSRDALRLAEAVRASSDGELVVAVVDEIDPLIGDAMHWRELRQEYYDSILEAAAEALGSAEFQRAVAAGSVPAALDRIAEAEGADLIVVGSTHRGKLGQVLPGSVGQRLLYGAPCAVAVAPNGYREHEPPSVTRLGVGYDGRAEARAALGLAADLARQLGAELRLITIAPSGQDFVPSGPVAKAMREELSSELETAARGLADDLKIEPVLRYGHPAQELASQGAEPDLLVVGSRSYGPLRRVLLGSVAGELIELAPCPVIVLPRASEMSSASA
jgi:nucleotide-binding universal stress UspA family protein